MRSLPLLLACAALAAALLHPVPARPWSAGSTGWCTDSSGRNFPCPGSGPAERPGERWRESQEPQPPTPKELADQAFWQGLALDRQGRYAEAEAAYRRAIALYSGDPAYFNNLGVVLKAQGRYGEAMDAWRQAVARGSALAQENLEKVGRWLEDRQRAEAASLLAAEADARRAAKDYAGAAALWLRILAMLPDHAPGWRELARCLRLQALDLDPRDPQRKNLSGQALEALRTALRLDPADLPSYRATAEVLDNLGRRDEAVVFLKESLRRGESTANVLAALRELIQYTPGAQAAPYLKALAELDPADAAARDGLARSLRAAAGNPRLPAAARLAAAQDLAARTPGDPDNQALLGEALLAAGQAEQGRRAFAVAFRLAPGDWTLRSDLGRSLEAAGDHAGAADAYRQAIALAGPGVEASERAALRSLLGLALEGAGDPAGAEAALAEGIALAPAEPVLHSLYGLYLERRKRLFAAEFELRQAQALAPAAKAREYAESLAQFQRRRGLAAQQEGRPEAAERLLSQAQAADPGDAELTAAAARAVQEAARVVRQGLGERAAALAAALAELGGAAPPAPDGRPLDFAAWEVRPSDGQDTRAIRQAAAAQAAGRNADLALDPERAAAGTGMNFDTRGVPETPVRIPTASPAATVPPQLRSDPILAALAESRRDLEARLQAQQQRTAAAEAARVSSPEAQAAASRERMAQDRLQQALDFILFSEGERVAELQRQPAATPGPKTGGDHATQ